MAIFAALALAGGGAWLWHSRPRDLATSLAVNGEATELVYATGFVEARQPVTISSRITAPVREVLVSEGDRVTRGQPLVLLADDEQRAATAQAAAQARAAAETEHRTLTLYQQGWVTRAARDQAVANADAARAATRAAAARQNQLVVRAETAGTVIRRDVYPGDLATPGKLLLQIGDPREVRVTATVDERDIARIQPGQDALMSSDAWPGRAIPAHVAEVTPGGDPTARAFRVRLLPDSIPSGIHLPLGQFPLGLSLEINVVTRRVANALLVPATSVANGKAWTIEQGRARAHAVTLGIAGPERVQVVSGLPRDARVVTAPPADLKDGDRVRDTQP
jgi:RND family efflux transporter MFP subunit